MSTVKKSHASRPLGLGAQEASSGGVQAAGSGPDAAGAEDPPHSRLTHVVAQAGQFAVHPAIFPTPGSPPPGAAPGRGSPR